MSHDITTPTVSRRELNEAKNIVNTLTWQAARHRNDYIEARIVIHQSFLRNTWTSIIAVTLLGGLLTWGSVHAAGHGGLHGDNAAWVIMSGLATFVSLIFFSEQAQKKTGARHSAAYSYQQWQQRKTDLIEASALRDWAARWHELVRNTTPEQMAAEGINRPERTK